MTKKLSDLRPNRNGKSRFRPGQLVKSNFRGSTWIYGVDKDNVGGAMNSPREFFVSVDETMIGVYLKNYTRTDSDRNPWITHVVLIGEKLVEFEFGSLEAFGE